MPHMAPLPWLLLFIFFLMGIFLISNSIIHLSLAPLPLYRHPLGVFPYFSNLMW